MAARESAVERREKKQRLIQLLHESSAASPDSGLLSNWSKNKGFLEPRSNWLHDCMFDFRCNFKIMAAAEMRTANFSLLLLRLLKTLSRNR